MAVTPSVTRTVTARGFGSVLAARTLLGGPQPPLAEARLQLTAQQEGHYPTTEQEHEFHGFHRHQHALRDKDRAIIADTPATAKILFFLTSLVQ